MIPTAAAEIETDRAPKGALFFTIEAPNPSIDHWTCRFLPRRTCAESWVDLHQ